MWNTMKVVHGALLLCLLIANAHAQDDDEQLSIIQDSGSVVLKVGDKRALFCKGSEQQKEWIDVNGNVVGKRDPKQRFHVEALPGQLVLVFDDPNLSDNGTWTCQANDLKRTIDIVIVEDVKFEPVADPEPPIEGRDQTLPCVASGIPPPTLIWYRDGEPVPVDTQREKYRAFEDGRLLIRKVNRFDSGDYECKAHQKQSNVYFHVDSTKIRLQVKHAPILEHETVQDLFAILNETKTLTCRATAYPRPTYKWTSRKEGSSWEGEVKPDGDKFNIVTDEDGAFSELSIRIESEMDLSKYFCTVVNSRGQIKTEYHLSQGNKPQPLEKVEFVSATNTTMVFRVTCGNCTPPIDTADASPDPANLPVTGYRFELLNTTAMDPVDWEENKELVIVAAVERFENQTDYTVEGLQPLTTYQVRVAAENLAGLSEFIVIEPQTTVAAGLYLTPTWAVHSLLSLFFIGRHCAIN